MKEQRTLTEKRRWSGTSMIHSKNAVPPKSGSCPVDKQPARCPVCLEVEAALCLKAPRSCISRDRRRLCARQTAASSVLDTTATRSRPARRRTFLRRGRRRARPTPGQPAMAALEAGCPTCLRCRPSLQRRLLGRFVSRRQQPLFAMEAPEVAPA